MVRIWKVRSLVRRSIFPRTPTARDTPISIVLMPELVSFVAYAKGPYYADNGDFSTAGSYTLYYKNILESPIADLGVGNYGYGNVLARCLASRWRWKPALRPADLPRRRLI